MFVCKGLYLAPPEQSLLVPGLQNVLRHLMALVELLGESMHFLLTGLLTCDLRGTGEIEKASNESRWTVGM